MLDCVSLKEAKKLIKTNYKLIDTEYINITESLDRTIATDIISDSFYPSFNRSTVDGYALVSNITFGASQQVPLILKIRNDIEIGLLDNNIYKENECVYIPTGGMIPKPFDSVIMIENTKKENDEVLIYSKTTKNENIIQIGEDIKKDEVVIKKGTIITPKYIGLLASLGITKINVYKKFNYSIISTGDEIIPIDQKLEKAFIRDINSYTIDSLLKQHGILINKYLIKDDYDLIKETIIKAFDESDVIFISGGSSAGKKDYTINIMDEICDNVLFHGISIKPGKPTMAGLYKNKMIIGLPGHPMASIMSLSLVFIDTIKEILNDNNSNYIYAKAKINFPSSPGKTTIMPVKIEEGLNELYATPIFYKSGLINILAKADGFIIIDDYKEGINKDELLKVRKL